LLSGQTEKFFAFLAWCVGTLANACKIICYKKSGIISRPVGVLWGIEPHTLNLSGFPKGHKKRQSEKLPF